MKKSKSVLIIDDDSEDQELVIEAFQKTSSGVSFKSLNNGPDALNYLVQGDRESVSLILLDLNMPVMSGMEVLSRLKNDKSLKQIPVIILTTSSHDNERLECYHNGANCFLTKPDDFDTMMTLTQSMYNLWLKCA